MHIFTIELTEESAKIIVCVLLGYSQLKVFQDHSWHLLDGFLKGEERKWISKADKQQLIGLMVPSEWGGKD